MSRKFLICYDISDVKRLAKVRKVVYEYAIGGQKSAIEAILDDKMLKEIVKRLESIIEDSDRVNIVSYDQDPICFGKADFIKYDKGILLI